MLASCSEPEKAGAMIHSSDELRVRYSLAGYQQTCYAVTVTQNEKQINGYVLGAAHPAIAEFEREARTHIPEPPPPPPPPKPAAPASVKAELPEGPATFAGLRLVDVKGHRVDLDSIRAPNVVLYFWSPSNPRSARDVENLDGVYEQFRRKGVEMVGIALGVGAQRARRAAEQDEAVWPIAADSGAIANQYHVNPERPYYILDSQRKVVASLKSSSEIGGALQKLWSRGGSQ